MNLARKWTLRLTATVLLLAALLTGIVLNPSLLYANRTDYNNFTIYHNSAIDSHLKQRVDSADLLEGVMRYFSPDEKGNEPTCYFSFEDHYVVDPFCYKKQEVSTINLKSVTVCTLAVTTFEREQELIAAFPRWNDLTNAMLLAVGTEFANQKEMALMNARKRYEYFLKHYPTIAQRVPLQYVASYLGIAQPSLSRLRRER